MQNSPSKSGAFQLQSISPQRRQGEFSSVRRTAEYAARVFQDVENTASAHRKMMSPEGRMVSPVRELGEQASRPSTGRPSTGRSLHKNGTFQQTSPQRIPTAPGSRPITGRTERPSTGRTSSERPATGKSSPERPVTGRALSPGGRFSLIGYKEDLHADQQRLFQENVRQAQIQQVVEGAASQAKKDQQKFQHTMQEYQANIALLERQTGELREDNAVLDIKLRRTQDALNAIQERTQVQQELLRRYSAELEAVPQEILLNLDYLYEHFRATSPEEICARITAAEDAVLQQVMSNQHVQTELDEGRMVLDQNLRARLKQQQKIKKQVTQESNFWLEKLRALEQENEKLQQEASQAYQARQKAAELKAAVDDFLVSWGAVLDFQVLEKLPQVNNFQTLRQIQETVFKTRNGKYLKSKAGEQYLRLANLCLKFQDEFGEAAAAIRQDVPEIALFLCKKVLGQEEIAKRLKEKVKTLQEETAKLDYVRAEVIRWVSKAKQNGVVV